MRFRFDFILEKKVKKLILSTDTKKHNSYQFYGNQSLFVKMDVIQKNAMDRMDRSNSSESPQNRRQSPVNLQTPQTV